MMDVCPILYSLAPSEEFPKKSCFKSIGDWLKFYNIGMLEETLKEHGFDDIDFVGQDVMNEADLVTMGINDPKAKQSLLLALKERGFSKGDI